MSPRRRRTPARCVGLVAATTFVLVAFALPAGAHGDDGTMGIEVLPGSAPLTARVRVLVEYANDGDVATGATVVAAATGPDGAAVGPVPLAEQGQGNYGATMSLTAPGTWAVTVTATNPAATAQATVTASATGAPPPTTAGSSSTSVARSDAGDEPQTELSFTPDDDSDGTSPLLLAGVAILLAAAAGVTVMLVRRR